MTLTFQITHQVDADLLTLLRAFLAQGKLMAASIADLTAEVAKNTTVTTSAIALIQGLSAQLTAAQNDPVAIQGIIDQLNANDAALAAAVSANTPAVPTPAPATP